MKNREIHPTAVVDSRAEIAEGVKIGPYCIIDGPVKIGSNTTIASHAVIEGKTEIGERNRISPYVSIGAPPQDIGYRGEDTRVTLGDDNVIREYVTINRATTKEEWVTIVGSNNYLMAYSHVAHDCRLANHISMANSAALGGHTHLGDYVNIGGLAAAHQFIRIGAYAFVGGLTAIVKDVPPFMIVAGNKASLYGVNQIGLRRQGLSPNAIKNLKKAHQIIWRKNRTFENGIAQVREEIDSFPELEILLNFFKGSKRGIMR